MACYDEIPALLERQKVGGRELPSEVLIRKKLAMYAKRREGAAAQGAELHDVDFIGMSPMHEFALFMNVHSRLDPTIAAEFVDEWLALHPKHAVPTTLRATKPITATNTLARLESPDELAVRSLLLGAVHSGSGRHAEAQLFLGDALEQSKDVEAKWVIVLTNFELAVLEMRVAETKISAKSRNSRTEWAPALAAAETRLDAAMQSCPNADMSSRLESRIGMLRNELATKRETLQ